MVLELNQFFRAHLFGNIDFIPEKPDSITKEINPHIREINIVFPCQEFFIFAVFDCFCYFSSFNRSDIGCFSAFGVTGIFGFFIRFNIKCCFRFLANHVNATILLLGLAL